MSDAADRKDPPKIDGDDSRKSAYASPAILWEEDYRPTAFGASCAKLPSDPPCGIIFLT